MVRSVCAPSFPRRALACFQRHWLPVLLFVSAVSSARAIEGTWSYAVQVSAAVSESPAQITLSWPTDTVPNYTSPTPNGFAIYRKSPGGSDWGSPIASLPGTATSYNDTAVAVGTVYEYKITKDYGTFLGYGYIEAGIKAPLVDDRGKVVLIVDNTFTSSLSTELTQLQQDLAGDGWTVLRHDVNRSDSVSSVKSVIAADYNSDPAHVKAVFLFGHIAVPYSGQPNPDQHPDHEGAWPADVYYGQFGSWTDSTINFTQTVNTDAADRARLTNTPGDGKFDQINLPGVMALQVGRVDLANMPGSYPWDPPGTPGYASETELLRQYLHKDHNFRTRILNVQRRAIVGDYFGVRDGEAFAASGYRSFAPLVGAANIRNLNSEFADQQGVWLPAVTSNDYLLSYACGAGGYWSIAGAGSQSNTTLSQQDVVNNDVHVVFSMMFGSWFGDWDNAFNNLLRSVLATPTYGLVSVWSGRPHWFMHPLGLGETIGYCAQLSQNNAGLYQNQQNNFANRVHIALMGDPTLRLHPVVPASGLSGSPNGSAVNLSWTASTDSNLVGYHVYRAGSANGPFTRLTSSPVTTTSFTDSSPPNSATYMVRAVKLESASSGSYYNASQGVFWNYSGGNNNNGGSWSSVDVGNVAAAGSQNISGTSGTVSGSGADIWGTADGFHFAYQQLTGDITLVARVTGVTNTDAWAKTGLMIRESLSADSKHAYMFSGWNNNSAFEYRTATGGDTSTANGAWSWLPLWIKLVRSGDTFTGYQSEDGVTWSTVGTISLPMNAAVYAGIAVTAHNNSGGLCTGTLDNITVSGSGGNPPPTWSDADVGSTSPAGSSSNSSGTFTINGSGADIWGTVDAFHYVYQQHSGDGTFVARVTSIGNTNGWAKAGIMIRDSLSANAPHVMMLYAPSNNSGLIYRSTTGGDSQMITGPYPWLPFWVKIVRSGSTFTAYQSEDGTSWTQVGSVSVPAIGTNAYVGLAVTSHSDGTLCTATIDNVTFP
jgi:regulation of enolase protein 1 (concanavalin A-like superfamily)